jgi:tRNA threonylcarbamoyladenosine biosynthesis protein TsaB
VIVLAVHSTTPSLAVALAEDAGILRERELPPAREHLENLALMIDDLLEDAGIDLSAVDGFAVATGPGSFSGIRVGMAVLKGMALALGKPLIGVSSLEILAERTLDQEQTGVALIDARRNEVYAAVYRRSGERQVLVDGPRLVRRDGITEILERAGEGAIPCGDADLGEALEGERPLKIGSPELSPAAACARIALSCFRAGAPNELHSLTPLYVRLSDAEAKKTP